MRSQADTETTRERLERVFLDRLDRLYGFLRARIHDDQLAEDLCQQVFLKARQAQDSLRGDTDEVMVSWLFRIARNESTNLMRRRAWETSWEAMGPAAPQLVDPGELPDAAVLRAERELTVATLLDRLTAEQRDLLDLRFAAGLSLVQIADILGISDVAARQRLRRTLAQLRGEIDDPIAI